MFYLPTLPPTPQPKNYSTRAYHIPHYFGTAASYLVLEMHKIANNCNLEWPFFNFRSCCIFISSPPPPQPVWMCARFCNAISLLNHGGRSTEHKRFLDENLQFKAGFKWLLKNFWSLRITKKYLTPCTRQLLGRRAIFSADGCPDGLWRIQLSLTAAVYYSDFAQQIIKNAAVFDLDYNLIYFEISSSRYFTR